MELTLRQSIPRGREGNGRALDNQRTPGLLVRSWAGLLGLCCASVSLAQQAPPDDLKARMEQAQRSFEAGRIRDALKDLEAIYANKPIPRLLLNIAECHLLLGQPQEALSRCKGYLSQKQNPDPQSKAKAEQCILEAEEKLRQRASERRGQDKSQGASPRPGSLARGADAQVGTNPSGGATGSWVPVRSGTKGLFERLWTGGPSDVWVGGLHDGERVLLHWNGSSFVQRPASKGPSWERFYVQTLCGSSVNKVLAKMGHCDSLWGSGPDDLWCASFPNLHHWDGKAWSRLQERFTQLVAGTSASDVWSYSAEAWFHHWNGAEWRKMVKPDWAKHPFQIWAIWIAAPQDIWAVGMKNDKPLILHGNGATWEGGAFEYFRSATEGRLRSVWGSGPQDVWAVGSIETTSALGAKARIGQILHWDGEAWSQAALPATPELRVISGSGPANVWTAGTEGAILRYVPRGAQTP